jgi:dolichol-phosphate mannosyltransferase
MKVSIVIPTYKEKDNIPELFERIFKVFNNNKIDGEIIIVDDDSQDGTIEIVNKYRKSKPVKLVVRKDKRGLASACFEGFKIATGEVFLVMDADLQHPPEKIPDLINAIKKGADISIGSRYIEGGSLGKWPIGRKIVSKGASALANILFSEIKDIKDKESGFFAFKNEVIKDVKLKPMGYKILLEILVLGNYNKAVEVGFDFGKRSAGESKLGFGIIFSYISHMIRLLCVSGKLTKLIFFCCVGLIGVFVNLGVLYLLTSAGLYYMVSGIISIEASVLANFFLNRAWTFKEEAKYVSLENAIIKDHATRFFGILLNYVCLFTFTAVFHMYYMISMLIGIIISTLWNFLGNAMWVWKEDE